MLKLFPSCQYFVHCVNILSICQCQLFARMLFLEGLEVCRWILLFTRMFLGVSGCLDVDIMWMLLFARMFFGGCLDVWMLISCGYYYLLECFWGGCLDVWMWISPNEKRERPPVPCCSPWDMSGTRMVYFFYFHRLHHHKSSLYLPGFNTFIVINHQSHTNFENRWFYFEVNLAPKLRNEFLFGFGDFFVDLLQSQFWSHWPST